MNRPTDIFENPGGRRGIRTPGTRNSYGSLANCWFQPLTHPSRVRYRIAKHCLKCGCKVRLFFSSRQIYRKVFSKNLSLCSFLLIYIVLFALFSPKSHHPASYQHRTTKGHRLHPQPGAGEASQPRFFVSSRGCKNSSPRKRIFRSGQRARSDRQGCVRASRQRYRRDC